MSLRRADRGYTTSQDWIIIFAPDRILGCVMTQHGSFGRRGASGPGTASQKQTGAPPLKFSYRELVDGLEERKQPSSGLGALFGGVRGAAIALSGCSMVLGVFVMVYLRGFARIDGNVTMLFVGATIALLVLPRLAAIIRVFSGKK